MTRCLQVGKVHGCFLVMAFGIGPDTLVHFRQRQSGIRGRFFEMVAQMPTGDAAAPNHLRDGIAKFEAQVEPCGIYAQASQTLDMGLIGDKPPVRAELQRIGVGSANGMFKCCATRMRSSLG